MKSAFSSLRSAFSRWYWTAVHYAADGLVDLPALHNTYMTNARIFALVLGLDLEPTK
jgi:hypothetical protein